MYLHKIIYAFILSFFMLLSPNLYADDDMGGAGGDWGCPEGQVDKGYGCEPDDGGGDIGGGAGGDWDCPEGQVDKGYGCEPDDGGGDTGGSGSGGDWDCDNGFQFDKQTKKCECPSPNVITSNSQGVEQCVSKPQCKKDETLELNMTTGFYSCKKKEPKYCYDFGDIKAGTLGQVCNAYGDYQKNYEWINYTVYDKKERQSNGFGYCYFNYTYKNSYNHEVSNKTSYAIKAYKCEDDDEDDEEQDCEDGQHKDDNGQCVDDEDDNEEEEEQDCEDGQHKDDNGQCVDDEDDNEEEEDEECDCDDKIQDCDDDGKPKCDICSKLDIIIGNQKTQIKQQKTQIKQLNEVKKFKPIVKKQQKTNEHLETIIDLLKKSNSSDTVGGKPPDDGGGDKPDDEDVSAKIDPWGAIRGFDIHQNRINATAQCPSNPIEFEMFGHKVSAEPFYLCNALSMLAPVFMFIAYLMGAVVIVRS